jgi:hypothetical protein
MTMRVSLAPQHERTRLAPTAPAAHRALLDTSGARVVLGSGISELSAAVPIVPGSTTLFAPRGAALAGRCGPLFVCDTGHHRLLVWNELPRADEAPADFVIGQPGFDQEGRNARGDIGAATLNVPTGIAAGGGVLAVADAWNHRVLLWHDVPRTANQPADVVLGQADFGSGQPNRGMPAPRADTLNWCYGVMIHGDRLFVADTGNRRVLMWERIPTSNGAAADVVIGQREFTTRDASPGGCEMRMRWPHGMAAQDNLLFVADAGSSRIMGWDRLPGANGAPCDFVLGQAELSAADHNRGDYRPTASSLNMPYGATIQAGRLVIADTANSRLLGFEMHALGMGAAATHLCGQTGFHEKGDNRWAGASRDSLCWPYGVAACDDVLVIADSGNNRVLLWERA